MRKFFVAATLAFMLASCSSNSSNMPAVKAKTLSKACDTALEPVRIYAREHTDVLTDEVRAEMKVRMIKSYDFCSQPELKLFRDVFLAPWAESISEAGSETEPNAGSKAS